MENNYINLNTKSYYSLLESCLSIDDIINFALNNNQKYAALADNNIMYGVIDFYYGCLKNNIKPIIGLEVNYKNNKLLLIAKNYDGYINICKISSFTNLKKEFIINEYLNEVFVIRLEGIFELDSDNFFVADNLDKPNSVAIRTVKYKNRSDYYLFEQRQKIKRVEQIPPNQYWFFKQTDFENNFNKVCLENLSKIVESVNVVLKIHDNNIPSFTNDKNLLSKMCNESLSNLKQKQPEIDISVYQKRLNYELDVISKKGFNDYFLIVADFVSWSKNNDIIIGPGRGSAAGSLVSYLLGITTLDPIKYNLIFERFLNPNRVGMPDIDIDVMDIKRDLIIKYIFEKYGVEHCLNIITFQKFKVKMALRDLGRISDYKLSIVDKIAKAVKNDECIDDTELECNHILKKAYEEDPNWVNGANNLVNVPRQISMHGPGIILSKLNLLDIIPIQNSPTEYYLSQYEYDQLEKLGLLKIDILSNKNLTIIYHILNLVKIYNNKNFSLDKINLKDQNVFNMLSKGLTGGIFQFESGGMTSLMKRIKPNSIEDLALVSALYRPGAKTNINDILDVRNKIKPVTYFDIRLKPILESTYGFLVYQEQIIDIVSKIANFDPIQSDIFRRAISKKKEDDILKLGNDFINGAEKNNFTKEQASKIFGMMLDFASYGFNKSHAISYAYISYYLAYLKYHYPKFFWLAVFMFGDLSGNKLSIYVSEARKQNIRLSLPDIVKSRVNYSIMDGIIYFGFSTIKGIGKEFGKKIINVRDNFEFDFSSPIHYLMFIVSLISNKISDSIIIKLIESGCFDNSGYSRTSLIKSLSLIDENLDIIDVSENQSFNEFHLEKIDDDIKQNRKLEIDYIGISWDDLNDDPETKKEIQQYSEFNIVNVQDAKNNNFNTIILINKINKYNKKSDQKEYAKIEFINNNMKYNAYCYTKIYEKLRNSLVLNKKYIAKISYYQTSDKYVLLDILKEI